MDMKQLVSFRSYFPKIKVLNSDRRVFLSHVVRLLSHVGATVGHPSVCAIYSETSEV